MWFFFITVTNNIHGCFDAIDKFGVDFIFIIVTNNIDGCFGAIDKFGVVYFSL